MESEEQFQQVTFNKLVNTVVIDSGEVDSQKVQDFLVNNLFIKSGEVNFVQLHSVEHKILVGFISEQRFDEAVTLLEAGVQWPALGKVVFGYPASKKIQEVTVKNVSYRMKQDEVESVFSRYGDVKSVKRTFWKGLGRNVWDGIVKVKLITTREMIIPRVIRIRGSDFYDPQVWHCSYKEMYQLGCFKCKKFGHLARDCTIEKVRKAPQVENEEYEVPQVEVDVDALEELVSARIEQVEQDLNMSIESNDSEPMLFLSQSQPSPMNKIEGMVFFEGALEVFDASDSEDSLPDSLVKQVEPILSGNTVSLPDFLVKQMLDHPCDLLGETSLNQIRDDIVSGACTQEQLDDRKKLLKGHKLAVKKRKQERRKKKNEDSKN